MAAESTLVETTDPTPPSFVTEADEMPRLVSFITSGTRTPQYITTLLRKLPSDQVDELLIRLLDNKVDPLLIVLQPGLLSARSLPLFLFSNRVDVFQEWVDQLGYAPLASDCDRLFDRGLSAMIDSASGIVFPSIIADKDWPGPKDPLTLPWVTGHLPFPYDQFDEDLKPFAAKVAQLQTFGRLWRGALKALSIKWKDEETRARLSALTLHPVVHRALYSVVYGGLMGAYSLDLKARERLKAFGRAITIRPDGTAPHPKRG